MASREHDIVEGGDLFILTGPTAVGKTELALRWAETFGAEIVSCDSLLFYRGMDIGTAKPSPRERVRVPHHLIDVAEPGEPWSIHGYVTAATEVVANIFRRGRRVLITGGSGFYLKSFLGPVTDAVEVPDEIARRVAKWSEDGLPVLVEELLRADPEAGESLDLQNPRRVMRALERCLASGRTVRQLQAQMRERPYPFMNNTHHLCLLEREREDLRDRIERRVDQMLAAGLVDEVRRLLKRGLAENPSAASAIGYRETIRYLAGDLAESQLRDEIIGNTNRLVKKQLTWFRHQLPAAQSVCLSNRETIDPAELFEGC